jgi:hypothetical protein
MSTSLCSPCRLHTATEWQKERCAELAALIHLEERVLDSYRQELAHLRTLKGDRLEARFGWESPAEMERFEEQKKNWIESLGEMWITTKAKEGKR